MWTYRDELRAAGFTVDYVQLAERSPDGRELETVRYPAAHDLRAVMTFSTWARIHPPELDRCRLFRWLRARFARHDLRELRMRGLGAIAGFYNRPDLYAPGEMLRRDGHST